jgi:uncharacterized protein YgiM (DUF1202 family)
MFRTKRYLSSVVLLLISLVGCGGGGESKATVVTDSQLPTVFINAPLNQTVLQAGQAVQIDVVANDDQVVARIELYVDNSLLESRVAPAGSALPTMRELFNWSASIVGPHTLQARAYDAAGQMGASLAVAVTVQSQEPPTSVPIQVTNPPAESALPPTALPQDTATPIPEQALVTVNTNANVRSGPGTNYYVIGALSEGQTAVVTGRNADSSWWQIGFQDGTAWIANVVVTANAQAFNAPVVNAPPPPPTNTPAPPTATPTSAAPTNTPAPTTGLRVDNLSLTPGQCTTLRWDYDNIKALYLVFGYGYDEDGQPGHGTAQVCPSVTTTYKARVLKTDGTSQTDQVVVSVSGGGCGDPWVEQFAPTTDHVAANTPFSIFWKVHCAKSVRFIKGGGAEEGVPGDSSKIDVTITADTVFQLKIEKNSGGFVYASFKVIIQ